MKQIPSNQHSWVVAGSENLHFYFHKTNKHSFYMTTVHLGKGIERLLSCSFTKPELLCKTACGRFPLSALFYLFYLPLPIDHPVPALSQPIISYLDPCCTLDDIFNIFCGESWNALIQKASVFDVLDVDLWGMDIPDICHFFTLAKFLEYKIYTEKTRKLRQNTQ